MEIPSFNALIQQSIIDHWDQDALTDYKGATLQYHDVARKIEKLHIMFENSGVVKGDKIALCGRNSANWAVAFLATLTYGAIAVPILHEFMPDQIHNIVNHSDAAALRGRRCCYTGRCNQDAGAGRYHLHSRLLARGFTYRQVDLCPRAPQRDVRHQVS